MGTGGASWRTRGPASPEEPAAGRLNENPNNPKMVHSALRNA